MSSHLQTRQSSAPEINRATTEIAMRFDLTLKIALSLALLIGTACESNVTEPTEKMALPTYAALTLRDSNALARLSKVWGAATESQREALEHLASRHGINSPAYAEHGSSIKSWLNQLVSDSTIALDAERKARLVHSSGAAKDYVGGVAAAGVINEEMSVTEFWLPTNPELHVETVVTVPAMYIRNRTTGSYVKLGQTYGIVDTRAADFQPPDVPGEDIPMLLYLVTPAAFIPLQIDCTKFGIEAQATTQHEAGWSVLDYGITLGTYTSSGTDEGQCPHVAPTAHFMMQALGQSGSDSQALSLDQASELPPL